MTAIVCKICDEKPTEKGIVFCEECNLEVCFDCQVHGLCDECNGFLDEEE